VISRFGGQLRSDQLLRAYPPVRFPLHIGFIQLPAPVTESRPLLSAAGFQREWLRATGDVTVAADEAHDDTGMFPAVYFFGPAGRNKHYKMTWQVFE
jgi:hypothetical protein